MKVKALLGYALLGLPLAMAMLPVYLISPKFYGDTLGVSLTALGALLFCLRLFDTVQDPWLGRWVDAWQAKKYGWNLLLCVAALTLALGFVMLFTPPVWSPGGLLGWLAVSLLLVYTSHSLMTVCYLTWGTRLSDDPTVRTRVSAWREAAGLLGVVLASILPALWVTSMGPRLGYQLFSWLFVVVLVLCLSGTLLFTPAATLAPRQVFSGWRGVLVSPAVRRVLIFFLLNAIAVALPTTLVLFYIEDVLRLAAYTGWFLGLYFVAGLIALPFWVWLANRLGKPRAWASASLLAICAMLGVTFLGVQAVVGYSLVCLLAGLALGADLALPVALLADVIPISQRHNTGAYFGLWALISKLALALAAGLSLPLLEAWGYVPGVPASATSVTLLYAFLPLIFKVLALGVLFPMLQSGFTPNKGLSIET